MANAYVTVDEFEKQKNRIDELETIVDLSDIKETKKKDPTQKKLLKEIVLAKRSIDLNSISLSNGTSESLNYLRAIRNRINSYVHRNYRTHMGKGEILLHFVLNSDGSVRSASIVKDDTDNNKRLKDLCLNSIYLSSPFKSFPNDLDLPQATFNISISFKSR